MGCVLVTRPEPDAGRTASRLRALGHAPLVLPLSKTCALDVDPASLGRDISAVAVTSANALRHASPALVRQLSALPCYAVGERTAAAARETGFDFVTAGPGDALSLAEAVARHLAGKRIAYLCGRERFPLFEERLAASGVEVTILETYDTVLLELPDERVHSLLGPSRLDAILLYSAKAADAAGRLAARAALAEHLASADIYALSPRIGEAFRAARPDHRGTIRIAVSPDEDALLALLPMAG
jgi:uroporphyrinogen-III synthase